jgi:hypothetical protein
MWEPVARAGSDFLPAYRPIILPAASRVTGHTGLYHGGSDPLPGGQVVIAVGDTPHPTLGQATDGSEGIEALL